MPLRCHNSEQQYPHHPKSAPSTPGTAGTYKIHNPNPPSLPKQAGPTIPLVHPGPSAGSTTLNQPSLTWASGGRAGTTGVRRGCLAVGAGPAAGAGDHIAAGDAGPAFAVPSGAAGGRGAYERLGCQG